MTEPKRRSSEAGEQPKRRTTRSKAPDSVPAAEVPVDHDEAVRRAVALTQAVNDLNKNLGLTEALEGRVTTLDQRGKTNRNLIVALAVSLVLDLVLTFGIGFVYRRVESNTHKIKSVQCSLYSLVLSGGYRPSFHLSDQGETPRQSLAAYNHAYASIIDENNTLGCTEATPPHYVTDPAQVSTTTLPSKR